MDSVLIVCAHPDDETIGASTALGSASALVHVTDGAPRNLYDAHRYGFATAEQYARARRDELAAALRVAGVSPELIRLGVPDQRATFEIAAVASELRRIVRRVRPSLVMTHPYEGGHPDHDACAVAVRLACADVPLFEFACYHSKGGTLRSGEFLLDCSPVRTVSLTAEQRDIKSRMFDCFVTQREMLTLFPIGHERFRETPAYDFSRPPHEGRLYYEHFDWGMTGERFRAIVGETTSSC